MWTKSLSSISPHSLQDFCCCERWFVRWGTFLQVWESLMAKNLFLSCFQCCGTVIFLLYLRESPRPERNTWNTLQYDREGSSTKRFPDFATCVKSHVTSAVKQRFQDMLGLVLLWLKTGTETSPPVGTAFPQFPGSSIQVYRAQLRFDFQSNIGDCSGLLTSTQECRYSQVNIDLGKIWAVLGAEAAWLSLSEEESSTAQKAPRKTFIPPLQPTS